MLNLSQPLAHLTTRFVLDGIIYEVGKFNIGFGQPKDHKGQPQQEVKGGQILITLLHAADDTLYSWAKHPSTLKNGTVEFQTDLGMTVLRIEFTNAYCVNLKREISSTQGTKTTLIISPEKVSLDGITHDNEWNL